MRTAVDIPDELFRQAKAQAALEGTTFKELVARGLRLAMEISEKTEQNVSFPILKSGSPGVIGSAEVKQAIQELERGDDTDAGVSMRH